MQVILFSSNACFCGVKFWIVIEFKEEFCSAHAPEIPTHNNTNTTHTNICICGACSTAIVNASNLLLLCEVLIFMFACWFVFKACAFMCVRVCHEFICNQIDADMFVHVLTSFSSYLRLLLFVRMLVYVRVCRCKCWKCQLKCNLNCTLNSIGQQHVARIYFHSLHRTYLSSLHIYSI